MNRKNNITNEIKPAAGLFRRGKKNSITDIKGVKVGHLTVNKDIEDGSGKKAFIRTGLTAILPYPMEKEMRLFTGCFILRGKNEFTGYEVIDDFCYLNSPIVITNSFNVGRVYDAILSYGFYLNRDEIWPPFVIGVNDSYLNDMSKGFFEEQYVLQTLYNASDIKVKEGSVGAGLGLRAFCWKGGIGSSSRILSIINEQFTLGALVASNHGTKIQLIKTKTKAKSSTTKNEKGSLTIIVGVDIPLVPYQIKQIACSMVVNLPSINTLANSSDTITCVLFTTANAMSMENEGPSVYDFQLIDDSLLEKIILAGSEAIKEAILNSLLKAAPVEGRLGRKIDPIPDDEFNKLLKELGGVEGDE